MYFVTIIKNINNEYPSSSNNVRTIGFWFKFEDAEYIVLNNICDINETDYNYAIIEELNEGLSPYVENSFLYKFDDNMNKYVHVSSDEIPLNMSFVEVG
jgi:hypothetical protein